MCLPRAYYALWLSSALPDREQQERNSLRCHVFLFFILPYVENKSKSTNRSHFNQLVDWAYINLASRISQMPEFYFPTPFPIERQSNCVCAFVLFVFLRFLLLPRLS